MQFEATILAQKGKTIECRTYDPAAKAWWDGGGWNTNEASAALVPLTVTVLSDPYQDRYTGVLNIPSGYGLIVEYLDASTKVVIGEDPVAASTGSAGPSPVFPGGSTVQDIFDSVLQRLNPGEMRVPFLTAIQSVMDVIVRRLWLKRCDLLKAELPMGQVNAGQRSMALPSDFLGFESLPYLVDGSSNRPLTGLNPADRNSFTVPGKPRYYEMFGFSIKVYPEPDAAYSVGGCYYQNPPRLTGMDSTIPFGGMFDLILADCVIMVAQQGLAVTVTPQFQGVIIKFVDEVLQMRNTKTITMFQARTGNQIHKGGWRW